MNAGISTYRIKKGDTLSSIADTLGISTEELRAYHNARCDLQYILWHHLGGVDELLLPPPETIADLKRNRLKHVQTKELPPRYLEKKFYAGSYQVTEQFESLDAPNLAIDYNISIELEEHKDGGFIAAVKKPVGDSGDDKISTLSMACMESISPVPFMLSAQGEITGIDAYENNIVKRFAEARPGLEAFFTGEINKAYLDKFQHCLNNEDFILKQFCSALCYQTLFPGMEMFYKQGQWKAAYHVLPNSFPVNCVFETEYNYENTSFTEIIIKGRIQERCSLPELLKGVRIDREAENPVAGEVELRYCTCKETKRLQKAQAAISIRNEEEQYCRHSIVFTEK